MKCPDVEQVTCPGSGSITYDEAPADRQPIFDDAGNDIDYTESGHVLGVCTINSQSAANEPSGGYFGSCRKITINWTQAAWPAGTWYPAAEVGVAGNKIAHDSTRSAAWVNQVRTDGPHFNGVTDATVLKYLTLRCNWKFATTPTTPANAMISLAIIPIAYAGGQVWGISGGYYPTEAATSIVFGTNLNQDALQAATDCWQMSFAGAFDGPKNRCLDNQMRNRRTYPSAVFNTGDSSYGGSGRWQVQDALGDPDDVELYNIKPTCPLTSVLYPAAPYAPADDDWPTTPGYIANHLGYDKIWDELGRYWNTLDLDSNTDVTFGFAVGVLGNLEGDYEIELLLDNLCLDWATVDRPQSTGTLIIDEPMTTLPSSWINDVWYWSYPAALSIPPTWTISGGKLTVVDHSSDTADPIYGWRSHTYAAGSLYKVVTHNHVLVPSYSLIVEARLHIAEEELINWTESDETVTLGASPPFQVATGDNLDHRRPEYECGIFIGGLVNLGMRLNSENVTQNRGNDFGNGPSREHNTYHLVVRTNDFLNGTWHDTNDFYEKGSRTFTCNVDEGDGFIDFHTPWIDFVTFNQNETGGNYFACPVSGAKVRIKITPAATGTMFCGETGNTWEGFYYKIETWINDRPAYWFDPTDTYTSDVLDSIFWPQGDADPIPIGVYARRGGQWTDFKCWKAP